MIDSKQCSKCKQIKLLTYFGKNNKSKDKLTGNCKDCRHQITMKCRNDNPELYKNQQERWRNDNKTKIKSYRKIKYLYGFTNEECDAMFSLQGGKCKICNRHQSEFKQRFHVDHDHETDKVRGLLCGECNLGLGKFKDNVETLEKAITYLKNSRQLADKVE